MDCFCGNMMILRLARLGDTAGNFFWGCSTYPECTYTKPYQIPIERFAFANQDFTEIINSLGDKNEIEREIIVTEIKAQMIDILNHFIECRWGAHFNTLFDQIISKYLDDPSVLDYVLKSDVVIDIGFRGVSGAKIFPDLLNYLQRVESPKIQHYLLKEFGNTDIMH